MRFFALWRSRCGFGLPLVEAMATGLPVIALNSEGQSDVCEDAGPELVLSVVPERWEESRDAPFGSAATSVAPAWSKQVAPQACSMQRLTLSMLAPGGTLIVSGITREKAPRLMLKYQNLNTKVRRLKVQGEWVCLQATPKPRR